ncbi:MAG: hypothetical protein CML67_02010 [Rhodobacteraceae bacterium]|nr:hypothetical protein [Paracoccaceae bacterium]
MSALDDIHDRRRLLDSDDRALAALAAAYPDGPPEDVAIEPMTDGEAVAAVMRAVRMVQRANQERGAR